MSHQVIYINSYDFGQFTAWSHLSDWFSVCCCSSLPEWDSERRGWMCVDSLSHSDRQSRWSRWRRRCCSDSSSAAGAVGSVHCTADSSAGEEAQTLVSFFKPLSPNKRHVFSPVSLQAYQLNLETRPEDTSISGLSYTRLFLSSFSQVMNSWCWVCFYFPHTLLSSSGSCLIVFLRWTVTATPTMSPCPCSPPSWSQSFVPDPIFVHPTSGVHGTPGHIPYRNAEETLVIQFPLLNTATCVVLWENQPSAADVWRASAWWRSTRWLWNPRDTDVLLYL